MTDPQQTRFLMGDIDGLLWRVTAIADMPATAVSVGATLDLMVAGGNARARLGTRLAIFVVNLAPLFLFMAPRTMEVENNLSTLVCFAAGLALRLLALHYHWRLPVFSYQQRWE